MKTPTAKELNKIEEDTKESCKRQFGKISNDHQNYIDGIMEGYRKCISWMIDNNPNEDLPTFPKSEPS